MLNGWSNWDEMALDGVYMVWIFCYAKDTEIWGQPHAKHYRKRKWKKKKKKGMKKVKKINGTSGRHKAQEVGKRGK